MEYGLSRPFVRLEEKTFPSPDSALQDLPAVTWVAPKKSVFCGDRTFLKTYQ